MGLRLRWIDEWMIALLLWWDIMLCSKIKHNGAWVWRPNALHYHGNLSWPSTTLQSFFEKILPRCFPSYLIIIRAHTMLTFTDLWMLVAIVPISKSVILKISTVFVLSKIDPKYFCGVCVFYTDEWWLFFKWLFKSY